jgi:hypothetical protein
MLQDEGNNDAETQPPPTSGSKQKMPPEAWNVNPREELAKQGTVQCSSISAAKKTESHSTLMSLTDPVGTPWNSGRKTVLSIGMPTMCSYKLKGSFVQ